MKVVAKTKLTFTGSHKAFAYTKPLLRHHCLNHYFHLLFAPPEQQVFEGRGQFQYPLSLFQPSHEKATYHCQRLCRPVKSLNSVAVVKGDSRFPELANTG